MKTINIQGKEYVTVNERIKYFREKFKGYKMISEIVFNEEGKVIFKALILDEQNNVVATGHAMEKENSTFINKTSHIENCETSAWGRALANYGIGVDSSVASADEVANAITNQNKPEPKETKKLKKEILDKISGSETVYDLEAIWNEMDESDKALYKGKVKDKKAQLYG